MFLSITLELTAGSIIHDVVRESVNLAKLYETTVLFTFNNIPFSITKNTDIKEIIEYYYVKINNK